MQGQTDTPLSESGRAQAAALGARLAQARFNALYASDLARAFDTARAVADACGCEIIADARLRERSFGIFEGLTQAEIAARYPEELRRFQSRDPDYAMPGGETARAFHDRCLACLTEIAERHAGGEVVVVTHGLVLDAVYRAAHAMPFEAPRAVPLLNASLNIFTHVESCWHLHAWGDVAHLDEAVVTQYRGSVA
jgi:probable phosphoglycerate mutase